MRRITWTETAKQDFGRIDTFYEASDPDFADRVGENALLAASFLAQYPLAGAQISLDGTRKWSVPGTDFRLFYRVTLNTIEIIRIRHAREDWTSLF